MQNYQNLIDELFKLTIHTVQYFVADGQVLYDQLPEYYSADTPTDRLPGYRSSFMSLSHYDQHLQEDRYADKLVEMQRQAVTDVLLLEPAQINRLLTDAKSKCERLTQLLKNAMKYQKAWDFETLDSLPAAFLELQLLDVFTIKSRPEASPHKRFAHHLMDAIMYKRGTLSGFIRQVETNLGTNPVVLFDNTSEPEYDLWYVNNDDAYAFAKLKELVRYLPTIEPFEKRAEWFFETSRIWEIETSSMGIGSRMIPNPENYSHIDEKGKQVDEHGQSVEVVAWGIKHGNDEEKGIIHKMYFLWFYRTHRPYYLNKPRFDVEQLIDQYSTQRQTERGKRLQIEWVTGQINDRQQIINDWLTANSERYGKPEIRRQLQNAAVLIEQELEGVPAIKWNLFYRTLHLDPFALLWGLVEYKRFLETEKNDISVVVSQLIIAENSSVVNNAFDDATKCQFVRSILMPLSGVNPQNQAIMSRANFDRLITYVDHLVLNDEVPVGILPISQTGISKSQTGISNEHIRYTFYRLHKQLFGTRKKRPNFIDFIHVTFMQFSGTAKSTTNSKFSAPPKSYSKDFAGYIGEIE